MKKNKVSGVNNFNQMANKANAFDLNYIDVIDMNVKSETIV